MIKLIISFILSVFFLKEYDFPEEKKQKIKKAFPYLLTILIIFATPLVFPLPNILGDVSELIRLRVTFFYFLAFSVCHWLLMINVSKFAKVISNS